MYVLYVQYSTVYYHMHCTDKKNQNFLVVCNLQYNSICSMYSNSESQILYSSQQ